MDELEVSAYTVPTSTPESDGTLEWSETTIVVASVSACGAEGFGYSYADIATARVIDDHLKAVVLRKDALQIPEIWEAMTSRIRNLGQPGICSMAISAVDNSLWDLKARLLNTSVADLLGRAHHSIPAYGSGGFTSYSVDELKHQLSGWAAEGFRGVKMKIGRDPESDVARVAAARDAIGTDIDLYVDANGAYSRKQAIEKAQRFDSK